MAALIPGIGTTEIIICSFPLVMVGVIVLVVRAMQNSSPSTPPTPAGWHPDPTCRHELRYWDGRTWTAHVSDQGAQSQDAM